MIQHDAFDRPVTVFVGLGTPLQVKSAHEAYAFMNEWPFANRRPGHTAELATCRIAMNGGIGAEEARQAFERFARRARVLAPAMDDMVQARALSDGHRNAA